MAALDLPEADAGTSPPGRAENAALNRADKEEDEDMAVLENIEPREVMRFFEELSSKHRCSQHEKDATDYIASFAEERGLEPPHV